MSRRVLGLALFSAGLALTTPAAASVTYEYAGHVNPTNSVSGFGATYVGVSAPLTFTFTLANALGANLSYRDISADVLSWTASGGQAESTITSSSPFAYNSQLELSTDALGHIETNFHIKALGQAMVEGAPTFLEFNFLGLSAGVADNLLFYRGNAAFNYGVVGCPAGCGGRGTFAEVVGGGGAPEPAGWALMIVGFGAVGTAMRRRIAFA